MIDADIGWGDQDRLGMGHRVEPIFAVAIPNSGVPNATERHRLDEQMDVDLIDRAAAKRQALMEMINRLRSTIQDSQTCSRSGPLRSAS